MLLGKKLDAKAASFIQNSPGKKHQKKIPERLDNPSLEQAFYYLYSHPNAPVYHKVEIFLHEAAEAQNRFAYSALASFYGNKKSPFFAFRKAVFYLHLALHHQEPHACLARAEIRLNGHGFSALTPAEQLVHLEDLECATQNEDMLVITELIENYRLVDSLQARIRSQYWQKILQEKHLLKPATRQ